MASAAILAIGTELLADGRADTNGLTLGRMLLQEGVETGMRIILPDAVEEIAAAMVQAVARHPLVVATGGLGPTVDDITREAACLAFGASLHQDEAVLESLRHRYGDLGRALSATVERQALVPGGAAVLQNRSGTAPGLLIERPGDRAVVLLPGVPHEMERIMREEALPQLRKRAWWPAIGCGGCLAVLAMKVAGLFEVQVQDRIRDLFEDRAVMLTLLASPGEISVIVRGGDRELVEERFARAKERLGDHVFTEDLAEGIQVRVGRTLAERGLTLAVAESCTGGLIGSMVTSVPGSSRWFLQGWIVYSNEAKTSQLKVPPSLIADRGAVSVEVAEAMATGARTASGADWALSVTGIAGPEGSAPGKPVGLVHIGLAGPARSTVKSLRLAGDREAIRLMSARSALDLLRRTL